MKPQFTTPEAKYSIACLASELMDSSLGVTAPPNLDWEKLLEFLKRNRLSPHFAVLAGQYRNLFPDKVRDALKKDRYTFLLYGDYCRTEVNEVLDSLKQAGIPVIVLKGWALIQWLYGRDHGQRFCEDIDILVPVAHVKPAEAILQNLGYVGMKEIDPGFSAALSNARAYQKLDQSRVFLRPFTIGFHWGLTHFPYYDRDRVNTDELFARSMPLEVAGIEVAELSHEDQVIYTCAHLALHHRNQENLLNYYEIAALLKRAGVYFDWKTTIERSLNWSYFVQMHLVLEEVDALFPGLIPSVAMKEMRLVRVSWRDKWIERLVAGSKGHHFRSALVELIALPGFGNKVRQTWLNLFPPREYMQHRYDTTETNLAKLYWHRVWSALLGLFRSDRQE